MEHNATHSLAGQLDMARWPTADEVVEPIIAALRRLNDLDGVADAIALHLDLGNVDAESLAVARAFTHLVGDIARRCRAVASGCSVTDGAVVGTMVDAVVRLIANDGPVVRSLCDIEHPNQ